MGGVLENGSPLRPRGEGGAFGREVNRERILRLQPDGRAKGYGISGVWLRDFDDREVGTGGPIGVLLEERFEELNAVRFKS